MKNGTTTAPMIRHSQNRSTLLLLAAISMGVPAAAAPAQVAVSSAIQGPTQVLLEKAHTLEAKGRMDMAAQTWQQVLLADPKNTEALGGLARSARLAGKQALAETYLQRLRAINPNDPGIARAESLMTQSSQQAQLQQAGKLAAAGNNAGAMALYRQVFGNTPPAGEWSLAYYETEAGTEDGRGHAIAALRALVDKNPQDTRYQVALGRILTYSPTTRSEGRKLLERHPNDPQAAEALRASSTFDKGASPSGAGRRDAVQGAGQAARRPGTAVRAASAETVAQRAMGAEERAAYAALNAKKYSEADTRFTALLAKNPHDSRALAGLGYVRMNQQNFGGAISFLEQAKQDGASDAALDRNLATSRFYYVLSEGSIALNENDLTTAEAKYGQALQMRPDSPEAVQGIGGTLLKAGQPQAAIPYYVRLLRAQPGPAAWRGLFTAQFQAGDPNGALLTERRIPPAIRAQLLRDPEYLRILASAYLATGRDADAQRVLRSALDLPFPEGARGLKAETQLQYASLLLQANHVDQASGLYRQVLAADPNNVLAWQGLVNTEHAMGKDAAAMITVESMPPAVYDQALRDSGFLLSVAAVYQSAGKYDLAQSLLERAIAAQNTSGQKVPASLQIQLASLYLQRNDAAHAYPIFQRVLTEKPQRVDAWKGLLTSLHASGRDGEALAEVQQIPPEVRKELETDVQYLQTVGLIYGSLGDSRQALAFLNRVQQHYAAQRVAPPADIDIQNAWLLYNGMNDAGLYRQLLYLGGRHDLTDDQRRTVQTIWASWAVRRANQASAANDTRRALAVLNAAARAFPDNPAVIKALAGGYVRAGLPKEAVNIFKARDMSAASAADYKSAIGASLAANDLKESETWLRYALEHYPRDGEILNLAAKFEQARGDNNRAEDYYKASLKALPPADPGSELAYVLHQPVPLNPRALPSLQSQDLATLLAPGAGSAATVQAQPYLPSYANAYGTAPVQVGAQLSTSGPMLPGETSVPSVPAYMNNPARSEPSRLEDYRPTVPAGGFDPNGYGAPQGSYQPPAALNRPRGVSENEVPADAAPVADLPDAAFTALQQEQIRRATERASSADPAGTGADVLAAQTVSEGNHHEGAQTGAFNGEVYGPYVPYQAPTSKGRPAVSYSPSPIDVPETTIVTDFPTSVGLPVQLHTAHTSGPASGVAHPQDEAAEAAQTRRHQSDVSTAVTEAPTDLRTGTNVQYGTGQQYSQGLGRAAGQTSRPPSLPPTATTGSTGTATVTGDRGAQQYPRPGIVSSGAVARRRARTNATPRRVEGFGVSNPPIFYPTVPTALTAEPYPDLPPYNDANGQPPTDGELIARNVPPLRGSYGGFNPSLGAAGGPPLTERQQTELDLAQLDASYSGWMGGSGFVRVRSGEPGIDRLYDFEIPVEATFVADKHVRFSIVPRVVFLNSGTIDNTRYTAGNAPTLGTLPANAINSPSPQFASGVGGELQAVTRNIGVAVGYTPYQFLVNNVTARGRYRIAGGPFTIFAERDSVKETQLSYAGLRDPGSVSLLSNGNIWGGVVASGGGLRFDHGNERAGFYLSGDGAALTGFHTLENRRYEGTAGAYFRVHTFPGYGTLNVGAQLFAQHFDHNERALSYGTGGYFSPEIYFLGGVPITFNGYYKTVFHYVIQGSVGVQTFQEDSANLFPLDPATQTAAQSNCTLVQLANRSCTAAFLPVNTSTGANFNVEAEFSYRITDHFYVGAQLLANNTNSYNMVQPGAFLRYTFKPQFPTEDYPTGLFPMSGFRPLRVP